MKVILLLSGKKKSMTVPPGTKASDLLSRLRLMPDAYIIVKNGEIAPVDSVISNGDSLELLPVASGG